MIHVAALSGRLPVQHSHRWGPGAAVEDMTCKGERMGPSLPRAGPRPAPTSRRAGPHENHLHMLVCSVCLREGIYILYIVSMCIYVCVEGMLRRADGLPGRLQGRVWGRSVDDSDTSDGYVICHDDDRQTCGVAGGAGSLTVWEGLWDPAAAPCRAPRQRHTAAHQAV